jgi:hypothetical protein
MGIEKVPREDRRKKGRCSANNLMELCDTNVNLHVITRPEADSLVL